MLRLHSSAEKPCFKIKLRRISLQGRSDRREPERVAGFRSRCLSRGCAARRREGRGDPWTVLAGRLFPRPPRARRVVADVDRRKARRRVANVRGVLPANPGTNVEGQDERFLLVAAQPPRAGVLPGFVSLASQSGRRACGALDS